MSKLQLNNNELLCIISVSMQINQKTSTILALLVIIGLMGVIVLGSRSSNQGILTQLEEPQETPVENSNQETAEMIVIYFSTTCSHCKEVEDWIEQVGADEHLTLQRKEVSQDRQNAIELTQVATDCGVNTNRVGVPFMYAGKKCFIGKLEILDYLKKKLSEVIDVENLELNKISDEAEVKLEQDENSEATTSSG